MKSILDKLEKYGVNMEETMARFINDEGLYLECLGSFLNDPCFDGLFTALSAENYVSAFDYAHTLKGVAGNLGLTPLYDAICIIVEALRHRQYDNLQEQFDDIKLQKDNLLIGIGGELK